MTKSLFLTGATRGLGRTLALEFWKAGYSLVLVARDESELKKLCDILTPIKGQTCVYKICDLSSLEAVQQLIIWAKQILTKIDVLINNAANQGPIGPLVDEDIDYWTDTFKLNLFAPVSLCKGLFSLLKASGSASVINLSGGGATGPRVNFSSYAASKVALVRFSETLAEELKQFNIRVNCIAPGAMKTDMLAKVLSKGSLAGEKEWAIANKVFSEGGASQLEVAELALFLSSEKSLGITGKLISAVWDDWRHWPAHIEQLSNSDVYTIRRIVGRDRDFAWGDK
jgi:NAD(P)-dependent dehydrogenase (short-subunit alcohol dehydrogenase family)